MALFVKVVIIIPRVFPVGPGWNDHRIVSALQICNQCAAVVAFIRQYVAIAKIRQQVRSGNDIVNFSAGQEKLERIAKRVHYRVELGGKASSTTTKSLFFLPPFAPAAC